MGRCAHTAEECNTALPTDQLHFVRLSSASAARHFGFTAEKTCASARFHVTTLFRNCQTTPFVCPLCVPAPPVSFNVRLPPLPGPRCLFTYGVSVPGVFLPVRSTLGLRPRFLRLLSWSRFRPSRGRAGGVCRWVWMVVRFVRVIRVHACARVSRVSCVCPGSPRCLFTGTVPIRHSTHIFFDRLRAESRACASHVGARADSLPRSHRERIPEASLREATRTPHASARTLAIARAARRQRWLRSCHSYRSRAGRDQVCASCRGE